MRSSYRTFPRPMIRVVGLGIQVSVPTLEGGNGSALANLILVGGHRHFQCLVGDNLQTAAGIGIPPSAQQAGGSVTLATIRLGVNPVRRLASLEPLTALAIRTTNRARRAQASRTTFLGTNFFAIPSC